ncbi:MAG TPA: hypothetical protein VNS22_18805 [Geminicoccus sp.]|nr:hypothetical protein [Geminicoccus sp.]HWL70410.1 hypothetical protein [Geminicoccus sp.]
MSSAILLLIARVRQICAMPNYGIHESPSVKPELIEAVLGDTKETPPK